MFKKVLVANRGEIARRIIRTLKKMGIKSVAVYSEADKDAIYLNEADFKAYIGPSPSKESYLNQENILKACKEHECEAIHPGFGFLSENPVFAQRCVDLNIKFIGPTSYQIAIMGDKNKARKTFSDLGFPVIFGSKDILRSKEEALKMAQNIGYPVLLKAKAGGGGKGMRLIEKKEDLFLGFDEAQKEAQNAFNDSLLYMEKFIKKARHIEFQVLGDTYNNIIILGERECSIQKNNQKLIEEAPANNFSLDLRNEYIEKLTSALKKIGYINAGTVEMLMDDKNHLYFMEMNTRIQVEHPVTEEITGIDIVKEQLKIAFNEKLNLLQEDIKFNGHAIEFRINAISPGTITKWQMPENIRLETHCFQGYHVPPFYDPMLLKLIVHEENRKECLKKAKTALYETKIEGINTTLDFHRKILENQEFILGNYDVGLLKR